MIVRLDVDLDGIACDDCGRRIRTARPGDEDGEHLCARCGREGPDDDERDAADAADGAADAYERWLERGGER